MLGHLFTLLFGRRAPRARETVALSSPICTAVQAASPICRSVSGSSTLCREIAAASALRTAWAGSSPITTALTLQSAMDIEEPTA